MKKKLTKSLPAKEFKEFYFTVSELKNFCCYVRISVVSSDRKKDLTKKVYDYLLSGQTNSLTSPRLKKDEINNSSRLLEDRQEVGSGFKFSRSAREYFEQTLDPKFKVSVPLLKWVKDHPHSTISELKNEYMRLKLSKSKRKIGNQFEYNQFTRDFFAANPGLTRQDCLKCWKRVREQKDRKYSDECLVFLKEARE